MEPAAAHMPLSRLCRVARNKAISHSRSCGYTDTHAATFPQMEGPPWQSPKGTSSPTSGIAASLSGRYQIDLLHLQAEDLRKFGLGMRDNEVAQGDFSASLRERAPPSGQNNTILYASAPLSQLL